MWFLRKAFNFGPLRLNLSKSGVGTSTGVTGLRVGTRPDGQDYLFAGRDGLYFRENLGDPPESTPTGNGAASTPIGSPAAASNVADEVLYEADGWPFVAQNGVPVRWLIHTDPQGHQYIANRDGQSHWVLSVIADGTPLGQLVLQPPQSQPRTDVAALVLFAHQTVDQLLGPFSVGRTLIPGIAQEAFDGAPDRSHFNFMIASVALRFFLGHTINRDEAVLVHALRKEFNPESYNPAEGRLPVFLLRRHYNQQFSTRGKDDSSGRFVDAMPTLIVPLEAYDAQKGTAYAEQARRMFFEIAIAAANADGVVTEADNRELDFFKRRIWTSELKLRLGNETQVGPVSHGLAMAGTADGVAVEAVIRADQPAAGSRLQQAKEMLDKGLISAEDDEAVKRRVLSDL